MVGWPQGSARAADGDSGVRRWGRHGHGVPPTQPRPVEPGTSGAGAAIEVRHLWKVFERQPGAAAGSRDPAGLEALERAGKVVVAVRDVSFSVKPGEIFIVMGLSGSGKSTLARCLLRLVEPTGGTIRIQGFDVTALKARELTEFRRHQVAMVFQHYGLLPHRTVLENVAFGLKLRGVPRQEREAKAMEAIRRVGLAGWEHHYPAALSGGMRQRVGIARALVSDAPVLVMDEPFSGLDPLIRREMQDELLRLQAEFRKTILFVTHDLDEALRLGDRMAVMRAGRFVQVGTPASILMEPADEYVERFVQDKRRQLADAGKGRLSRRLRLRLRRPSAVGWPPAGTAVGVYPGGDNGRVSLGL